MRTPFDLIQALRSWFFAKDEAIFTGGKDIDTGGGDIIVGAGTVDGVDLTAHAADTDAHHTESHTVASHSDTSATGSELNTLTDGSDAGSLHIHDARYYQESEFSSNPGANSLPLKSDASGDIRGQTLYALVDVLISGGLSVGTGTNPASGVAAFATVTAPGTPSAGIVYLYFKSSDGRMYYKNSTGTEYGPVGP